MIAAVKGRHAAWAALLMVFALAAAAADDPASAARELAAKTAAFANGGAGVTLAWRNASSLGPTESGQIRSSFEAALRQAGSRIVDAGGLDARVTLSENAAQYLLVEDARRGDERQVWISAWTRKEPAAARTPAGLALDRRLVWEQEEQILDVAFPGASMLVLSPSSITLYAKTNSQWEARQSQRIAPPKAWPRDLHGRLRTAGATFQAFLPGMTCNGGVEPALTVQCRATDEPWVLESGSRALLLANFTPTRNYFDGRVVAQNGAPRSVPPFYTAASVEDRGQTFWLLALVDGRTQIFDNALNAASGSVGAAWGSDIAGIDGRCGPASEVLATGRSDGSEPDAIQAFSFSEGAPQPMATASTFSGPVTALWTSGGSSAVAVVRDLSTGRYAAYVLTLACGS
jgi:hypothetical protein